MKEAAASNIIAHTFSLEFKKNWRRKWLSNPTLGVSAKLSKSTNSLATKLTNYGQPITMVEEASPLLKRREASRRLLVRAQTAKELDDVVPLSAVGHKEGMRSLRPTGGIEQCLQRGNGVVMQEHGLPIKIQQQR